MEKAFAPIQSNGRKAKHMAGSKSRVRLAKTGGLGKVRPAEYLTLLKDSALVWNADRAASMGAAIAYFSPQKWRIEETLVGVDLNGPPIPWVVETPRLELIRIATLASRTLANRMGDKSWDCQTTIACGEDSGSQLAMRHSNGNSNGI